MSYRWRERILPSRSHGDRLPWLLCALLLVLLVAMIVWLAADEHWQLSGRVSSPWGAILPNPAWSTTSAE
ncbi:hypothetical protein [Microvirga antarctica]|uniref:hypothetical protein n=1 Tax=Microvirga antarctica TaxID=2819233 RepID=UPI001B308063|nr:hypothetical protein [Microvirga antarctica]